MAIANASTSRINNFDLLRLVAATQVMIEHTVGYLRIPRPPGWTALSAIEGVPIFFVISGFLISASWKSSPDVRTYAVRRAARIFPGLWCCILLTLITALIFGSGFPLRSGLTWLAAQSIGAIYTPVFLMDFGIGSYNTSLWTIPVELQFYIVIPAVYFMSRQYPTKIVSLTVFATFAVFAMVLYEFWLPPLGSDETGFQKLARYSFVPHFYMFMAGVVIREFNMHTHPLIAGKGFLWVCAYAIYFYLVPHDAIVNPIGLIVGRILLAITVIALAYTLPKTSACLLAGTDISYGVYIYHGLLINVAVMLGLSMTLGGLITVITIVPILAIVSWFALERPILEVAHRRTSRLLPRTRIEA
jgi:peptidoglycan/LPS O-acetylase OafA/YrhL